MFYYLIYNSSIIRYLNIDDDNKILSMMLGGTFSYIILHAILSLNTLEISQLLLKYFWIFLFLDIGCIYYMYHTKQIKEFITPIENIKINTIPTVQQQYQPQQQQYYQPRQQQYQPQQHMNDIDNMDEINKINGLLSSLPSSMQTEEETSFNNVTDTKLSPNDMDARLRDLTSKRNEELPPIKSTDISKIRKRPPTLDTNNELNKLFNEELENGGGSDIDLDVDDFNDKYI